jgi:hypothetical protein
MTSSAATTIRQRLDALRPQLLAVATCHGFVNKDRLYLESIRDGLERIAEYTAMGEKAFMASRTWACTSSDRGRSQANGGSLFAQTRS